MSTLTTSEKTPAEMSFGEYFYHLVNKHDVSRPLLLSVLGVSKTYLYDMFKDRVCAPTPHMQFKIASVLAATDKELSVFFDKAAERRGEIPADIVAFCTKKQLDGLRKQINYGDLISRNAKDE